VQLLVSLAADRSSQKCAESAARILSLLIHLDETSRELVFDANGVQVLSGALGSGSSELSEIAGRSLAGLASSMDELSSAEEARRPREALSALVEALCIEGGGLIRRDHSTALLAASAMSDVSPSAWRYADDLARKASTSLLQLIGKLNASSAEAAAWALWSLASSAEVSGELLEGIGILLGLAKPSEPPRCQEASALLVGALAAQNADEVLEAGVVEPLLKLLACGTPRVREAAIWAVGELARASRAGAAALREAGALEALAELDGLSTPAVLSAQRARQRLSALSLGLRAVGAAVQAVGSPRGRSKPSSRSNSEASTPGKAAACSLRSRGGSPEAAASPRANPPPALRLPPRGASQGTSTPGAETPLSRVFAHKSSPTPKSRLGRNTGTHGKSSPMAQQMRSAIQDVASSAEGAPVATFSSAIADRLVPDEVAAQSRPSFSRETALQGRRWSSTAAESRRSPRSSSTGDNVSARRQSSSGADNGAPPRRNRAAAESQRSPYSPSSPMGYMRGLQASEDPDDALPALLAIREELSRGPKAAASLIFVGLVAEVVRVYSQPGISHETKRTCTEVLELMSMDPVAREELTSDSLLAGDLSDTALVGTPKTQRAAMGALEKILTVLPGKMRSPLERKVASAVTHLVSGGATRTARVDAAKAISSLCSTEQGRRLVCQRGVVSSLARIVLLGSVQSKVAAANALCSIAVDEEGRSAVEEGGGVSALAVLSRADEAECLFAALRGLAASTEANPRGAATALSCDVVPRLVSCLSPTCDTHLCVAAARVLSNLAASPSAKEAFSGKLTAIVTALSNTPAEASVPLLSTIGKLSALDDARAEAVTAGALPAALKFLRDGGVRNAAGRCLRNLAVGEANQKALLEQGILDDLRPMLVTGEGAAVPAVNILWNLMTLPEARAAAVQTGLVELLLGMMTAADPEARGAAAGSLANLCSGPEEEPRVAFVASGGLTAMISAVRDCNPRYALAAEHSARTIRNVAGSSPRLLAAAASEGAPRALLHCVRHGASKARETAVLALFPFISADFTPQRQELMDAGGLEILSKHALGAEEATPGLRQAALMALRALLDKCALRSLVCSSWGLLAGLAELMAYGKPHGQDVAAYVLWDTLSAADTEGEGHVPLRELLSNGIVEGLICAQENGNQNTQHSARCVLQRLTGGRSKMEAVVSGLLALLAEPSQDVAAGAPADTVLKQRARAARSLACLTRGSSEAISLAAVSGAVSLLVRALDSDSSLALSGEGSALREAAARCLWNMSRDRELARSMGSDLSVTSALVAVLALGDRELPAAAAAAGAISNLASELSGREAIVGRGGLELVLQLIRQCLRRSAPEAAAAACGAMRNLVAHSAASQSVAATVDGPATLVAAVTARLGPAVEEAALAALGNLAAVDVNRDTIVEAGAVPSAVSVLKRHLRGQGMEAEAQLPAENAARLLALLCSSRRHRTLVATTAGTVPALVRGCWRCTADGRIELARALRLLVACPEGKAALLSSQVMGGVDSIVRLLRDDDPRVAEEAAHALWNLCHKDDFSKLSVAAAGGVSSLMVLFRHGSAHAARAAAGLVCDLAALPEVRDKLIQSGATAVLLQILGGSDSLGKEEAAWGIASLAAAPKGRREVAAQGGAAVIARLLSSSSNPRLREVVAWTVNILSIERDLRKQLIDAGVPSALSRMSSDSDAMVREAAREAFDALNCKGRGAQGDGRGARPIASSDAADLSRRLFVEMHGQIEAPPEGATGPSGAAGPKRVKSRLSNDSRANKHRPAAAPVGRRIPRIYTAHATQNAPPVEV